MKYFFYLAIGLVLLASCTSSKDYLSRVDQDQSLFDAVKALNKHPDDSNAKKALPALYSNADLLHLKKINAYNSSAELGRWEKIIDEYNILQKMYDAISGSPAAASLVRPINYQSTIYDLKQQAAEDYYRNGIFYLDGSQRNEAKMAYTYFQRSDKWVPGYKDAKEKMNEAYRKAIITVVINPVLDNSFFINSGWGNMGNNYTNEYFQQTLVRELGGKNAIRYPAKFYTEADARRENIQADWVVELSLRNIDIPHPSSYTYTRNINKQVEVGRDSSGHPIYQNVNSTVYITRMSFTARVEMEVNITELATRRNISYKTFRDEYSWQQENGTYNGDSRALGNTDWDIINNTHFNEPRNEDILNELYRRIYPRVRNEISYATDW